MNRGLTYYAFDIPYYQDHDLSSLPLRERKMLLRRAPHHLPGANAVRAVQRAYRSFGEQVLRRACGYGVEGVIVKRADSPYLQKRTRNWVKKKCINRQEFVVGGFTEPKGARAYFGSLLLGYYDEQHRLMYCGNVGTGFSEESVKSVYDSAQRSDTSGGPLCVSRR